MSIVGYCRSISSNNSLSDVGSFVALSIDCPRELVELVFRTLPLVISRGGCGVSEVAADVKAVGDSAGSSSSCNSGKQRRAVHDSHHRVRREFIRGQVTRTYKFCTISSTDN